MKGTRINKLYTTSEESEPEVSQINGNGKIPPWLKGTYLRIGPAFFDFGKGFTVNHLLDGYAMLQKFSIDGDMITFEKKWLQSDAFQRAVQANYPVITEFGTSKGPDPNKNFLSRMLSRILPIELSDNNHISLFTMGKELFATSETCYFRGVCPKALTTKEKFDTNKCFGTNIACAHPMFDESGAMFNIGSTVITGTKYNIIRTPPPAPNASGKDVFKKAQIICSIPSSWTGLMSYNHSFAMTKNYIVMIEQPFVMNIALAALTYLKGPAFREWLEWRPELRNTFFLVEKATGKLIKTKFLSKDPFFFLHQINAYEESDQIVVDILAYPDPSVLDSMYLEKLRNGDASVDSPGACHRYVIPLINAKDVPEGVNLVDVKSLATAVREDNSIILTPEIFSSPGLEFPTIRKSCCSRKYSYIYAAGSCSDTKYSNTICKLDVKRREEILWQGNEFDSVGEPMFIPNPEGTAEDDGIIISAITNARNDSSDFLLVLDASNMQEIGRAKFKSQIPVALHGLFMNQLSDP